jgi:cytidylate kinase
MTLPAAIVVALDGPAGAGKSTVARLVARALGLQLVDTGALYRAVALCARERGLSWDDGEALGRLAASLRLALRPGTDGGCRVVVDDVDRADDVRTPEISTGASAVSKHPAVRAALLGLQRRLGRVPPGAVLEGRDIGTVVFPDAEHKFFVTASDEVRARRRFDELVAKGRADVTFEETLADQRARDLQDSSRAVAPLRPADDARVIDTSDMAIDEVVSRIVEAVRRGA